MVSERGRDLEYNISKEELYRKYVDEGLSIDECADYFRCSTCPIEDRLRRIGIEIRNRGNQPLDIPEEVLHELYVVQGLSTVEIAKRFDCHNATISNKLREYGIPTTGPNHGNSLNLPKEELIELYVDEGKTTYELAERYGCDPTVIERRIRWYGIETRHTTAGDGDLRYKYGSNWRKHRKKALEKADYRCEICSITDGEHRVKYKDPTRDVGLGLDVHHRVPVRLFKKWDQSIEDANQLSNLQVLCQECHLNHGDRVGASPS